MSYWWKCFNAVAKQRRYSLSPLLREVLKYNESWGIRVNKSHAACYATISYQTAWMKYHYPAEYMCSVMSRTTFKKLPILINNCRKLGLRILPPHINRSQDGFTNIDNAITFGFSSIKGLGSSGPEIVNERMENGDFLSVKDFVFRMLSGSHASAYGKTMMANLIKSGAFDDFCDGNRASLLTSIDEFADTTRKMLAKQAVLSERKASLTEAEGDEHSKADEIKKLTRSVASAEKAYDKIKELYTQHAFLMVQEDVSAKLNDEYELLGLYLSGNPFTEYSDAASKIKNRTELVDVYGKAERESVTVCGIIKETKVLQRKSDGQEFASFTLFDDSGEIEVKCYTKAYAKLRENVIDGMAVCIVGYVGVDRLTRDDGTQEDIGTNVSIKEMSVLKRNDNERIIISGTTVLDWQENYDTIKGFATPTGYAAFFHDEMNPQLRKVDFLVSKDILNVNLPGLICSLSRI